MGICCFFPPQESPGRHQQQAADVPGEVPLQTETAFQRPTQPQKQVLPHVIRSHQPATEGTSHSWTKRTKITNLVHLNFCYNSGGEFNPLLVYMSDPCTQGLHQLRAVKDEPLEFCLYTQTSPILTVFTNLLWTQIYARCTHSCYQPSHFTSSTQSKDDHRTQEQELNHCCYAHAFVWNCLTTLFLHVTVLFWRCVWVV